MATYTAQSAYEQPIGAVDAELVSSPPAPWATYEDLPETPRATFTDQVPYLQSPVPAYMELRASPPTPKAPNTEELASPQPTDSTCIGVMQSTAIAMTFQGLEALCMLQLYMIIHSTASTRQPNIGLNRRMSSSSTESSSPVPNETGITTHGIAEANGSHVKRNNMQTISQKRKFQTRLSNKDYSPSKRTKKNKPKTSRASFQLMALYLKDADSPPAQAKEWKYEWNSKFEAWVSDGAPEGFQLMSGGELYMHSDNLRFQVRPNAGWLPVYMTRDGIEFRGSDSLEPDWLFTIADDIMQLMLIENISGEGTVVI
ncbi:hypothetical protein FMUND_3129 [Fusarium mundagurra]|uniref:Uncharacterized protein n=1 Tax=Fusarium mundagurra TaxID=1567541 RepID=A0A8H5Z3H3_9HYPO|nr:hypothetical protein FMUND_3129 [Fusarium mundagurra]